MVQTALARASPASSLYGSAWEVGFLVGSEPLGAGLATRRTPLLHITASHWLRNKKIVWRNLRASNYLGKIATTIDAY
jgi:hypothetical protein